MTQAHAEDAERVPQIPVLNYHHVHDGEDSYFRARPELLREQMQLLLEEGYEAIGPDQLIAAKGNQPRRSTAANVAQVLVSFDDAYENFLHHAWPVLEELSIPATVFVIVEAIGGSNDWDDTRWAEHRHLDLGQLRELVQAGVHIGSHTISHRPLVSLETEDLVREVRDSRSRLQDLLQVEVNTLAYPGGAVAPNIRDLTAQHYDLGFATTSSHDQDSADPYLIARFDPCFCGDPQVFLQHLAEHGGRGRSAMAARQVLRADTN